MPDPLLIVENGTVVSGANSYVTVDQVTAYALTHDGGASWATANPDTKVRACVYAFEYLRNGVRYQFRGTQHDANQRGSWPRDGATRFRGQDIAPLTIPFEMLDAQCDLAMRVVRSIGAGVPGPTTLQPDLPRGGAIQSKKVGPLETTYFAGAPSETVLQSVAGILANLLRYPIDDITPLYFGQHPTSPYLPGQFDYGRPSGLLGEGIPTDGSAL